MLPSELVHEIITIVARDYRPDGTAPWLRSLSLVCKAWTRPVQNALFTQFTLGSARPGRLALDIEAQQTRRLAFLASRPDLAGHVTHLRVFHLASPAQATIRRIATTFPNLTQAEFRVCRGQLDEATVGDVLSALSHIRHVILHPLWYLGAFNAKTLVRAPVSLQTLEVAGSCPLVADTLDALAQTSSKSTIQALRVRYMGRTWSDALARCSRAIFQFSDLRALHLSMSGVIDARGEPTLLQSSKCSFLLLCCPSDIFADVTFGSHASLERLHFDLNYAPDVAACVLHAFLAQAHMPALRELRVCCRDGVENVWTAIVPRELLLPRALAQSLSKLAPQPPRDPPLKWELERCVPAPFVSTVNHLDISIAV
jgi:hypothetical protein